MKLRNLLVLGSMAVMGAAFMSCSKDVAFDSEGLANQAVQKLNDEYDANFAKRYGAIDPNQTWDFATMTPIRTLPSMSAVTRDVDPVITVTSESEGSMTIDADVINWMHQNMKAGSNNSSIGSPFYSVASKTSFTIVPFYQGIASYFWELWMNVGGKEFKIWQKYDGLQYKDADGWHSLNANGVPSDATEVQAPTYTFTATKGAKMFFFLKVWKGGDAAHTSDGSGSIVLSSLDQNMRALENVPGIEKPSDDKFVYIIGCEDASDKDFEDLAFLFIGPRAQRVDELEEKVTKRYMMEDLGDTDDFDFNDVVVDVTDVSKKKIIWKENVVTGEMEEDGEPEIDTYQEAIVRAAGGIYNFTLKIGDKEWTKNENLDASSMLNTGWQGATIDYSKELDKFGVTGWVPSENNISLTVYMPEGNKSATGAYTITFPRKGTAPKMIAVDPTQNWMTERNSVPSTWWYE